jgi:cytoskeletal protein CcmA (bactofilin family)
MKKGGELNGFLDRGSTFRGEMEFEDTMRVDGRFIGKIISKNELIIGDTANVEGELLVGSVAISGTVRGKIKAGKIEVHRNGRVFCDIETAALVIEEGGTFEGNCSMSKEGKAPSTPPKAQ